MTIATLTLSACSSIGSNATSSSSGTSSASASSSQSASSVAGGSGSGSSSSSSAGTAGSATATSGSAIKASAGTPTNGGTLRTFASSDPGTMDPALITGYDQGLIAQNVLEGLYRLDATGTKVDPGLAASATLAGNTWTIKLRDAKFSTGDPVTASDVKFSFDRLVAPKTASPRAALLDSVVGAAAARSGQATGLSGIKVIDAKTLTITLAHPDASFQAELASPNLAVVSQKAVESEGANFGRSPVSAAPFVLSNWVTGSKVTAKANTSYWAGRPYLDAVEWDVIADESTRMVNFEAGTLDIAWLPPSYYAKYADDPNWKDQLVRTNSVHTEMFAINMTKAPLATSVDARQAICYGVDRAAAIASLQGRATDAVSLAPPGLGAATTGGCTYDVAKAAALAKSGGLSGKTLDLITRNWSNQVATMQLYQANLKAAGIDVKLEPLDDATYASRIKSGDYDMAWTYRVPDFLDASSYYDPLLQSAQIGSGNAARLKNAQIDSDLAKALSTVDAVSRTALYQSADRTAMEQLAYVPLLHNVYVDIHAKNVHDYTYSALDLTDYSKVWISS